MKKSSSVIIIIIGILLFFLSNYGYWIINPQIGIIGIYSSLVLICGGVIIKQRNKKHPYIKKPQDILDSPITDLRMITITWEAQPGEMSTSTDYFVHKDHVDLFIQASVKLHADLTTNPHSGNETARAINITVNSPSISYCWWSTPDLQKNDDEKGAGVINFFKPITVWKREKELKN